MVSPTHDDHTNYSSNVPLCNTSFPTGFTNDLALICMVAILLEAGWGLYPWGGSGAVRSASELGQPDSDPYLSRGLLCGVYSIITPLNKPVNERLVRGLGMAVGGGAAVKVRYDLGHVTSTPGGCLS